MISVKDLRPLLNSLSPKKTREIWNMEYEILYGVLIPVFSTSVGWTERGIAVVTNGSFVDMNAFVVNRSKHKTPKTK